MAVSGCLGSDGGSPTTDRPTATPTPTETATATATPTPTATPELPNVQTRIVQRDRAAITHVNALVTGEIRWPSLTVVDPTQVYGTWEQIEGQDAIRFSPDGSFTIQTSDGTIEGEYRIDQGQEVVLNAGGDTVR